MSKEPLLTRSACAPNQPSASSSRISRALLTRSTCAPNQTSASSSRIFTCAAHTLNLCTQKTFCFFLADFTCAAHTLNLCTQPTFCFFLTDFTCAAHNAQPVHPTNLLLPPHGFHVRCSHAQPVHPTNLLHLPHGFHVRCSHAQPVHFHRRDSSMSNIRVALGSGVGINKDIRHIVTDIPTYIIVANRKIQISLGERRWTGTISTTLKSKRILSTGFELELSLQPERTAKPLCIPNTVVFMPKPGCCSVLNLNRYKFRC